MPNEAATRTACAAPQLLDMEVLCFSVAWLCTGICIFFPIIFSPYQLFPLSNWDLAAKLSPPLSTGGGETAQQCSCEPWWLAEGTVGLIAGEGDRSSYCCVLTLATLFHLWWTTQVRWLTAFAGRIKWFLSTGFVQFFSKYVWRIWIFLALMFNDLLFFPYLFLVHISILEVNL